MKALTTILFHLRATKRKQPTRDPCESQPYMGHLTSKLNYRWFPSYLLCDLLIFPFHLLPSRVHPTRFSFCFFPGFLAIFTLLSLNNNNLPIWKQWCRVIINRSLLNWMYSRDASTSGGSFSFFQIIVFFWDQFCRGVLENY